MSNTISLDLMPRSKTAKALIEFGDYSDATLPLDHFNADRNLDVDDELLEFGEWRPIPSNGVEQRYVCGNDDYQFVLTTTQFIDHGDKVFASLLEIHTYQDFQHFIDSQDEMGWEGTVDGMAYDEADDSIDVTEDMMHLLASLD